MLDFLISKSNHWRIDFNRYDDFQVVAEKFGYRFKGKSKSQNEVHDYLKVQIKVILSGSKIPCKDFSKIEDHLALSFFSSKKNEYEHEFKFLGWLRFFLSRLDSYTDSLDKWIEAKDYLEALLSISNYSEDQFLNIFKIPELKSQSITFLRDKGFNVSINEGEILLSEEDEKRLLTALDFRFKGMGKHSVYEILAEISRNYSPHARRYMLRPSKDYTYGYSIDVPWGYLFNLSLANYKNIKKPRNLDQHFNESVELAKHFFAIKDIQYFSQWEDINHNKDSILPAIQRTILYDQHFSINQISDKHMSEILEGLSSVDELNIIGEDITLIRAIFIYVSSHCNPNKVLEFSYGDIVNNLNCSFKLGDIKRILNLLSFNKHELNKGYLAPEEVRKRNFYTKPFIKLNDIYVFINSNIFNNGFYFVVMNLCFEKGLNRGSIGDINESILKNRFIKNGVNFTFNKKYKVSKKIQDELNSISNERECDFIIESQKKIIFIEIKSKAITSEAMSGNTLESAIDLSLAFLHPLSQAGYHEYLLRRDGEILFSDGSSLELNNREIERLAISSTDFFGIQDNAFLHQVLKSLINAEVDSGDKSRDHKINKYLDELRNQYKTPLFLQIYKDKRNPFFNCRFFSIPQILEILSHCNNNEEFVEELDLTRHFSTGSKDWFLDYNYRRQIRNSHEKMSK